MKWMEGGSKQCKYGIMGCVSRTLLNFLTGTPTILTPLCNGKRSFFHLPLVKERTSLSSLSQAVLTFISTSFLARPSSSFSVLTLCFINFYPIFRVYSLSVVQSELYTNILLVNVVTQASYHIMKRASYPYETRKNLLVVCKVALRTIILRDNIIRKH